MTEATRPLGTTAAILLGTVDGRKVRGFNEGVRPVMSSDVTASPVETLASRPVSRRALLRCGGLLGAAGIATWATQGALVPLAAQAADAKKIVWSKDAVRVYLVAGGRTVRAMACVQNARKTPNGIYTIWSFSRAVSYHKGRQVHLPDFAPFYRRPGAAWNIGFHAIPVWAHGSDAGKQIHEDALLGTDLESGGCIRLSATDAAFLHAWAPVGTTVVVQNPAYVDEAPATAPPAPTVAAAPPAPAAPVEPAVPVAPPEPIAPSPSPRPSCVPTRRWFLPWRKSC